MQDAWDAIITGEKQGTRAELARIGLGLGSLLYGAGLAANHWIYDSGLKPRTQPALPVISVGNLSVGGTGKTTTAAFLARRLHKDIRPAIVLRGYRREAAEGPLIVSDGDTVRATLDEAGDEALMLAQSLPGCAVAVGKRREQVIEALRDHTGAQAAILDDGLQYFRMQRRLEIVLLDALADAGSSRLFPAGRLREPWRNLRRAHQVWITHADLAEPERVEALKTLAHTHCPEGLVTTARHRPGVLRPLDAGGDVPESLDGLRVIALSGLGNPDAFERGVAELGADVLPLRFSDHHLYGETDYARVTGSEDLARADLIVTTEKDAVKLPPPPSGCPAVAVLGCEMELLEGAEDVEAQLAQFCADIKS